MRLVELVKPQQTALTTLATVNSELDLTTGQNTSRDQYLRDRIQEASDEIVRVANKRLARARVMEPIDGSGSTEALLELTPLVQVDSVTLLGDEQTQDARDDDADDYANFRVDDPEAGIIVTDSGWYNSRPVGIWLDKYEMNQTGRRDLRAKYWGGYLLPSDNVAASGITLDAATKKIALPAGFKVPLLCSGERVTLRGFATTSNNDAFTVVARSATDITVAESLTDEVGPSAGMLIVSTLPGDWERYCLQAVKSAYLSKKRDPKLLMEHLADWGATYDAGRAAGTDVTGILPSEVISDIERRNRRMTY